MILRRRLACTIALTSLISLSASPTLATIEVATATGIVYNGTDYTGVFFPPGTYFGNSGYSGTPSFHSGAPVTVIFEINDAAPGTSILLDPPDFSSVNTRGPFGSTVPGAIQATIVLNGTAVSIDGTYSSSYYRAGPSSGGSEVYIAVEDATGSADNAAGIEISSSIRPISSWDYRTPLDYSYVAEQPPPGVLPDETQGSINLTATSDTVKYSTVSAGFSVYNLTIANLAQPTLPSVSGAQAGPTSPCAAVENGAFCFAAPTAGEYFDPPAAKGFSYSLAAGGDFTIVGAPPSSYGFGPVKVVVDGVVVDTLAPGAFFAFGPGVSSFELEGITPTVNSDDPAAFPTYLDFSGSPDTLIMTPLSGIPEPRSWAMLLFGVAGIGVAVRTGRAMKASRKATEAITG